MPPKKKIDPATAVFTLKATLRYVHPPVWRRSQVRGNTTLAVLHRVLQAAFGWENHHMHGFLVGKQRYGQPDPELGMDIGDENEVTIAEVAPKTGKTLVYIYDFGDSWKHDITVENVARPAGGARYPDCVDGAGACPPEDSGGPPGYANNLAVLSDPKHPDHEHIRAWMGDDFDPEAFDLKRARAAIGELELVPRSGPARVSTARPGHTPPSN